MAMMVMRAMDAVSGARSVVGPMISVTVVRSMVPVLPEVRPMGFIGRVAIDSVVGIFAQRFSVLVMVRAVTAVAMLGAVVTSALSAFVISTSIPAVRPGGPADDKNDCTRRYDPFDCLLFHDSPLVFCLWRLGFCICETV